MTLGLLGVRLPTLGDPHVWDALSCYLSQARLMVANGLHWAAYRPLPFVRPPVIPASIAALLVLGASRPLLHLYMCLWAVLALLGVHAICRALGGGRGTAVLAMALCAATPLFLAQTGLVQTDLPAAALCAWAWALLLRRQVVAFALVGSLAVLTKESSYYLCLPAALLLVVREGGWTALLRPRALVRALPAIVPGLVLLIWLLAHRQLTGHLVAPDHRAALFTPGRVLAALLHNFVEGGRWCLVLAGAVGLRAAWRGPLHMEALMTGIAAAALPLCFAGLPPRYMLPSLPPLCALAALGLHALPCRRAVGATVLLFLWLVLGWDGDSWHDNSGHHLESNLAYRRLIRLYQEAARVLAAEQPVGVIADFPLQDVLRAPPEDGYLPTPLRVTSVSDPWTLETLCHHDFLVEAAGGSVAAAKQALQARGALSLWRVIGRAEGEVGAGRTTPPWARVDHRVYLYRVRCSP